MNELHENELGYFADSLTPHQRVFLQRMLGEFLTALPQDPLHAHPEQVQLLQQNARVMFQLLELLRRFEADDRDSDIRPFAMSVPEPGHALIVLSPRILNWRGLWDHASYEWLKPLRLGRLSVDLRKLEEINSSTIAWLVNMAGMMPDRRIRLLQVAPAIQRSLAVLKLDQVLVCEVADQPKA